MVDVMLLPFLKNMDSIAYIQAVVSIKNGKAFRNEELIFQNSGDSDFGFFSKELYNFLGISYSKFFKMDSLSKLAFLSAEILLHNQELSQKEKTGIFMVNSSSSLDTDRKYFETMKNPGNYFPSPALFVYTLPNIMMGELSIRHKITGENAFFIFDEFEFGFVCDYVNLLFELDKISSCLLGWVDVIGPEYESILFNIQQTGSGSNEGNIFNAENLKKLYYGSNN